MFDKLRKNTKKLALGLFPILMGLILFVGVSSGVTLDVVSDTVKDVVSDTIVPIVVPAFTFEVITAAADTFQLPLEATGTYDFHVDWGDSSSSDITVYNHADTNHSYAGAGTYVVKITGTIQGWRFANAGDKDLIHDTSNWGPLRLGPNGRYFYGCTNLTVSATDILDITDTVSMLNGFRGCLALTEIPNINIWNFTTITNAAAMFTLVTLSTANYDALILSWSAQAQIIVASFGGGNSTYTGGGAVEAARDAWVAKGWVITDGGATMLVPFLFFGGKLRKKRYADDYKTDMKKAA